MTKTTKTTWKFFFALTIMALTLLMGVTNTQANEHAFRQGPGSVNNRLKDEGTGKTPATPGAQPWMVGLIEASEKNAQDGHFCGGSLIAPDLVLTAAHCVEENSSPDEIDIVAGRHILSTNAGDRVNVDQVYIHQGYFDEFDGEDNDIAILKLDRPVTAGTPIKLIGAANEYVDDAGAMARVTGWGVMGENSEASPDDLHGVDLPIVSQEVCRTKYGSDLQPDGICAGVAQGGKDSCYGDSGGPLTATDRNGDPVQVGVVSWGNDCGENYGIYARVTEYETWVRDIRNGDIEPTDMSELGGFGGDDDWSDWGEDDSDWGEGADDGGDDDGGEWWPEDGDDDDWFSDDSLIDADVAVLPAAYDLVYDDTFAGEQEASWEGNNGDTVDLYATDSGLESLDELIEEFGGHDGRIITVNGTKVLLEQLEDDNGDSYNSAAYVLDGITVEIYGSLTDAQMTAMVRSLI